MTYHEEPNYSFKDKVLLVTPNSLYSELSKHPSLSQIFLKDIGFYPDTTDHAQSEPKGDNHHTLVFNIKGSGYSRINTIDYTFNEDHFIIIPKGVPYMYGSDSRWSIYWIHFVGERSDELISEFGFTYGRPYPIHSNKAEVIHLLRDIISTLQMGFSLPNYAYAGMILWHVLGDFLFRDRLQSSDQLPDPVDESILFMKKNLHRELTLDDLASAAGYSSSYFAAQFKERTGTAPISYFINLKMALASEYLNQTSKTIKEISYLLGYSNQYYFSRLFKTHIGMSPSKYRISHNTNL